MEKAKHKKSKEKTWFSVVLQLKKYFMNTKHLRPTSPRRTGK